MRSDERSQEEEGACPEFKAKVGLEALRGVKTINEIGMEYGSIHVVRVEAVGRQAGFR